MNYTLASTLQSELVNELKSVFAGMLLKSASGKYVEPQVYSQRLPLALNDDDDELSYAPYVIVMLSDFKIEEWYGDKHIHVILVICTYDGGANRQGDKDCHLIMDRVLERFGKNPHLGGYALQMPVEGAFQDKDTYPIFYGALELNFTSTKVETEDELA